MADKPSEKKNRSAMIIVALIGAIATIVAALIAKGIWMDKDVNLVIFAKDRATNRGIASAAVILHRPTRREERTTDGLGIARFSFSKGSEGLYRVAVNAPGYRDESREIDVPKGDSNEEVSLDALPHKSGTDTMLPGAVKKSALRLGPTTSELRSLGLSSTTPMEH
jgi:hypothetical protein